MAIAVEEMDRAALALAERMRRTVLPICGATPDGKYDAIGSGVLVRFGDRRCLATAKHVLDENEGDIYNPLNNPTTLYIGNTFGMAMGYQVAAAVINETEHTVRHDPLVYSSPACDRVNHHLRIPIDPQRTVDGRSPVDVGPLNGWSGGGVFALKSLPEPEKRDQLAAIIIEYDPEFKGLVATDVNTLRHLFVKLDGLSRV